MQINVSLHVFSLVYKYSGIPSFRTSSGNENWFEISGSKEMWDEITVFDQWEGNNFWLSYWQVLKIKGSRNRDSTLDHFKHFHCKP